VQGEPLLPLCSGKTDPVREYALIEDRGSLRVPLFEKVHSHTIRTERFKLTHYSNTDWGLLFDLEQDPNEFVNLYGDKAYAGVVRDLRLLLLDVLVCSGDPPPFPSERF
jgi:hypothetical protein